MHTDLSQIVNLVVFAKIVQAGGISRCAAELGIERTTVSRRLRDLEQTWGVMLLDRSPKHTVVTDAGRLCYERCEHLLEAVEVAESAAKNGEDVAKTDPIIVGAPADLIEHHLGLKLSEFEVTNPKFTAQCYPKSFWTKGTFSSVDLQLDWERPKSSDVFATRIARIKQSVCASSEYLAKSASLASPRDIEQHPCIVMNRLGQRRSTWKFERDGACVSGPISHSIEVSSLLEATASVVAGLGLCRLPDYLCERYIEDGRLIKVLPEYSTATRDLFLLSPGRGVPRRGVTALHLFLEEMFKEDHI